MKSLLAVLVAICATFSGAAAAHRASDAFLTLETSGATVKGHWEIALRDLQVAAGVDANHDGRLTWGELLAAKPALKQHLISALQLQADGKPCPTTISDLMLNDRLEGRFAWFELHAQCPQPPDRLSVHYGLLFDIDPTHRGIVVLNPSGIAQTAVLSPGHRDTTMTLATPSMWRTLRDYVTEGIHHIWIGADHVLFLISLLLPCVLLRSDSGWRGADSLTEVTRNILGVITAFTVAHSLTLTLAALGIVSLPSRLTESAIALSVVVSAMNNLKPIVTDQRWVVAFVFGLVHGFGFASVLGELGLPTGARVVALLAFNLGVELGQLSIVLPLLPLLYFARRTPFYQKAVLQVGSAGVALVAMRWLLQRALAL